MGTGVGEAMLIGAAVGATAGGAGAAIQGGDPLKGALTGGALGAVGGGLGGAFGGTAGAASGSASGATAGGAGGAAGGGAGGIAGGASGVGAGSSVLAGSANPALYSSLGTGAGTGAGSFGTLSPVMSDVAAQNILSGVGPTSIGLSTAPTGGTFAALAAPTSGTLGSSSGIVGAAPTIAGYTPGMYASGAAAMPSGAAAPTANILGYMPGEKGYLSNTALASIGGGSLLGGMMQAERNKFGVPSVEPYESSFDVSKFQRSEPTYAPEGIYVPEYRDYRTAAEGGIMKLANGGPVERMSMMNTAMNPQGGLYPQGMIDKTQYATPIQRPVSSEMVMEDSAYERSNPMLMAEGGKVKGYAAGGMPSAGSNLDTGTTYVNPFKNLMNDPVKRQQAMDYQRSLASQPGYAEFYNQQTAATQQAIAQPTGQSTFPGAASMQSGFGQGAQGYPSFTMGSGGFGGGSGGAFPLEGKYGIVRMAEGGIADIVEAAKAQGLTLDAYQNIYGRGNAIVDMQKALKEGKMVNMADGGISSLGGYSDGGRMLKGPGDGMSDSIPGVIGGRQPARLADGEFVVPADVVSHLGNGSTDAGAKQLYSMMDKVRKARTGKKAQGKQINPRKYMPA